MDFAEPFEESVEIARSYLAEVDAPLILVGVADDTELRRHFLAALRQRLDDGVDLRDFRYDSQHLSLVEGALAAIPQQSEANGHRIAISAVGLEALPRDKQSEAIKLLNAQRNRLGYARLAVILWLNRQLFAEVANKSYDFYSWSSHTFFLEPPAAWSAAQRLDSLRRSYLQAIVNQNEYVNLAGLAPMRGGQLVQMRMREIFVPLCVERKNESLLAPPIIHLRGGLTEEVARRRGKQADEVRPSELIEELNGELSQIKRESRQRVEISELLHERRAVVLGDPGAGKTTMLRYVAYRMAKSLLNGEQREAEQAGTPALPGAYLPVYMRIGLYAQHLKDHPETTIADFAPQQDVQLPLDDDLLRDAIERGQAMFLLDGLDEIIATAQRREVAQAVEAFARAHPACPVIVTSRVVGYREAALGGEFAQFTIRPFDDAEIEAFVRHWHAALGQPERAASLLEAIKKQEPIRRLASNPLLLTVIALIALRNVKLPNRRVELYQKAAETLVDNWMSERRVTPEEWNADEALTVLLPAIAWHLHTQASGGLINQEALLADSERTVREAAARALGAMGERAAEARVIERLLALLADGEWYMRSEAADSLGKLSAKLRPNERPRAAELFFPLTRKKGKSEPVRDQRNAGYVALRNVLAAEA